MGIYVDPGNESFRSDISSDIYVDKTEMISILNSRIGTNRRFFAVSRARRFGKSMVAGMLDAYYSLGCESKEMFAPYKISAAPDFDKYINKYHVLHFDMTTSEKSRVNLHIYNPNSLVEAYTFGECESYWKNTGAFGGLNNYIAMNMDGLKDAVIMMLTGEEYPVDTGTYQNDLTSFKNKDDVLTALIHMGYLGYDPATKSAFIPNEEVRDVFESAIKVGDWNDVSDALHKSDKLLKATWENDSEKVAEIIAASHQDYTSILEYHDENSLALAIMVSYYTARKHYMIIREMAAGKGFADVTFVPKRGVTHPAMIVELKWDKNADTAISQIHNKNYDGKLKDYGGNLILVGINYDKAEKIYTCRIEKA